MTWPELTKAGAVLHADRSGLVPVVPGADMAEAVEHTLCGEDQIGGNEIADQLGIDRTHHTITPGLDAGTD